MEFQLSLLCVVSVCLGKVSIEISQNLQECLLWEEAFSRGLGSFLCDEEVSLSHCFQL